MSEFNSAEEVRDFLSYNATEPTYLTTKQYAEKLGVSMQAIRTQIMRGKLNGRLKKCQCGQGWLIMVDEI